MPGVQRRAAMAGLGIRRDACEGREELSSVQRVQTDPRQEQLADMTSRRKVVKLLRV